MHPTYSRICAKYLSIGCLGVFLMVVRGRAEQNFSAYLKTEAGLETNILESDSASRDSYTTPVWSGLTYRLTTKRLILNGNATGGLIPYTDYSAENKASVALSVYGDYTFCRSFFATTAVNIFNKWWCKDSRGYFNSDWYGGFGFRMKNCVPVVSLILGQNSYRGMRFFNDRQTGGQAKITFLIAPGLTLSSQAGYLMINYLNRRIYRPNYAGSDRLPFQCDELGYWQVGLESRRLALSGLNLKMIRVRSNNDFSEYSGASVNYYYSRKIGSCYLQLIADVLLKKYAVDLSRYYLYYNPDPEQNIQNQLLIGWEWPFWRKLAFSGRAAVMRNETHFSGLYYDKWFLSFGLLYRVE